MADLHRKTARLNELERERLELEARLRMVTQATGAGAVRVMKRSLSRVRGQISRLERELQ